MARFLKYLPYLVLVLAVIPLFGHFYLSPVLGDEGVLAMDGWRIFRGEVPHRDFFQFIPPLAGYVQAFVFKIFSPSIFSVRLLGTIYGIVLLVLTFLLYRKFLTRPFHIALALSPLIALGAGTWQFGSHHWLVDILQISSMILLLKALEMRSVVFGVVSGIPMGLAVFTLQDQGGYGVIGLFIACLFLEKKERKIFFLAASSAVVVFAMFSLPLLVSAGFGRLYKDWVSFPLFNYARTGGNQAPLAKLAGQFAGKWNPDVLAVNPFFYVSRAVTESFVYLSPLLSAGCLVALFLRKTRARAEMMVISILSLAFLLGAFHRLALTNLTWAFVCQLPVFMALEAFYDGPSKTGRRIFRPLALLLFTAAMIFGIFQVFAQFQKSKFHRVETRAGHYSFLTEGGASAFYGITGAIEKNVPENGALFCIGYIPLVNFVTQRPNPTRYNFIIPGGYYSKEQVMSFVETLEIRKIEWGISERAVFDGERGARLLPRYEVFFQNGEYILWKRK